ncbi:MAG: XTP/dITP diphosphatase [Deltaproteobacteria bacterium]|nr:XTP/dITP diphosphatase [Deltaproteobacteria bacterium]
MKRLVIASKNRGKIEEIRHVLDMPDMNIRSLADYDAVPRVVENGRTYLENALKKAKAYADFTGEAVLADDSGLEVDSLNGEPGIHSARYAGPDATDEENYLKLLKKMEGIPPEKRGAGFRCVLVLYRPGGRYASFEGFWRGMIHTKPLGNKGFGYDPVFFLPDQRLTAAELPPEMKNALSHRAQVLDLFRTWLQNH